MPRYIIKINVNFVMVFTIMYEYIFLVYSTYINQ